MPQDLFQKRSEATAFKTVFYIVLAAFSAWLIFELRIVIICVLLAITIAAAIAPVAEWGEKRKIPRALTVIGIYLLIAAVYTAVAILLFPEMKAQSIRLYDQIDNYIMGVAERFPALKEYVGDDPAGMKIDPKQIRQLAPEVARRTMTLTAGMLGAIVNGILILFLATYFVIEANDIWPKLLRWLPHGKRERFAELILPLQARMGGYVRGQILVSIAVATFLAAGLSLLGVNNGLVLGALAGLFNIVPFVGSMISLVLSVVVALNQSVLLGGLVVGLFAVEQWLESSFITPHLLGRQVDLHPLIVLFAILIGGTIMGVPGALVAVPAAAALTFLAQEFYLKPLNGETTVAEEAAAAVAASDSAEAEEAAAPPDTTNAP